MRDLRRAGLVALTAAWLLAAQGCSISLFSSHPWPCPDGQQRPPEERILQLEERVEALERLLEEE